MQEIDDEYPLYKVIRVKEHDKYKLMTHVDMNEGKLYIKIIECNVSQTDFGAPVHNILESLSIFSFPIICSPSERL